MLARISDSISEKRSWARSKVSDARLRLPLSIITRPAITVAWASSTVDPSTMATAYAWWAWGIVWV